MMANQRMQSPSFSFLSAIEMSHISIHDAEQQRQANHNYAGVLSLLVPSITHCPLQVSVHSL